MEKNDMMHSPFMRGALKWCIMIKLLWIIIVSSVMQVSAGTSLTYSQTVRLNIKLSNVDLEQVIWSIKKQTEFNFFYSTEEVRKIKDLDVNMENVTAEEVLDQCLIGTNLTYEIVHKAVIIKLSPSVKTIDSTLPVEEPQKKELNGKVTDSKGEPIPGTTVFVRGATVGTITNAQGSFTLNVPTDAKILVFSFVGYKRQEISIGIKTNFNITLEEQAVGIEEVVAIGYGTAKRSDLTGSIGSVQMKELTKAPVKSFDDAMGGRIAGVSVTSTDGQPGSLPNIVIRGGNSLTQSNSPLYVVDGFPLESNDNNSINPNDIESIDVLKDASATAIYGARGANGVIMITTKSGKTGIPTVNFSAYYGIQKDIKRIALMNPYDFVALQLEMNPVPATTYYLTEPGRTLNDYKNIESINWYNEVLQTAPMKNYDLSVSGGTGKSKYYISGSYLGQDGIFVNSGFKRYQGRISMDQEISNKLRFRVNSNYSYTKNFGAIATSNGGSSSASLMYSIWAYRPVSSSSTDELLGDLSDPAVATTANYRVNPILQAKNELRESISQNLLANAYIEWDIVKGLKLKLSGGISSSNNQENNFNNSKTRTGSSQYPQSLGVNGQETFLQGVTFSNENTLTYSTKFGRHSLSVVGGYSQQLAKSKNFGAQAVQLSNENLGLDGLDQGTPRLILAGSSSSTLQSYFVRVSYDYKSKYIFTPSIRTDGSSKFVQKNRWGYFPSAAFAYRLSEEKFMKSIKSISSAKLRVGYGLTGNNRVGDFSYLSTIGGAQTWTGYAFGNTPTTGTFVSGLDNPDLKWETTAQFNVGVDLSFLKNRISFTGDYYRKKTKDLLLNADLPYMTGYERAFKNIGSVSNQGVELTLNTVNIQNSKFSWRSDFNISFNRSEVLALTNNQTALTSTTSAVYNSIPCYIAKIGRPVAMFYGVIFDGVYQYADFDQRTDGRYVLKGSIPANGTARSNIQPGDSKLRDINGDGNIDLNDYTVIGNPNPDFTGGFNNTFEYKGFDLSVFFQFSYGNEVMNANRLIFEDNSSGPNVNMYASYTNRWTPQNPTSNIPRAYGGVTNMYTSRVIEDASYLRLKTVSLGYTFSQRLLTGVGIKSLRVYASAQNLYTWTGYSGIDPEVSTRNSALTPGFDYSPYPRQRTFITGLNLTF